MSIYLFM